MKAASATSLKYARRLYHRKKFAQVISILEKDIFNFYEDAEYFMVLGCSYFQTSDLGGAEAFFQRVLKIDPKHREANLGLSLIASMRGDPNKAVRFALALLDGHPNDERGLKLLETLRRIQEKEKLQYWVRARWKGSLSPRVPGKPFPWRPMVLMGLLGILVGAIGLWVPPWVQRLREGPLPEQLREGVRERGIDGMPELIRFSGEFDEIFQPAEIEDLFRQAQDKLQEYRDNEARVLLNRILRSNASDSVRAQAASLLPLLQKPDMTADFLSFPLDRISLHPNRYEGTYVRWQGSVANLQTTDTEIHFDFLVGYHEGRILEGVVSARLGFAVRMDNGDPVDLLAQIAIDSEGGWYLVVKGIHVMGVRRSP